MIRTLSRLCLLLSLVFACGLLTLKPAHAAATCTVTSSSINFGSVNVFPTAGNTGTGAVAYTCTNYNIIGAASFTLCATLGTPSSPGTTAQPAMLAATGSTSVNFNLYTNAPNGTVWTSTTYISAAVTIPSGFGAAITGSMPFYGAIPGSQSSAANSYAASFTNTTLDFVTGTTCGFVLGDTGGTFTLPVSAVVSRTCTVSAGVNLNFGSVASDATSITGSTGISVTCPSSTPYYVGLSPSNVSLTGAGVMSGTGTDKVPYQLRSSSGTGPIWGNTATSTSVGNGVAGTGIGAVQGLTVYASVASAQYTPGAYSDTVTVDVNY
jgi:spore coat protein U-like protein